MLQQGPYICVISHLTCTYMCFSMMYRLSLQALISVLVCFLYMLAPFTQHVQQVFFSKCCFEIFCAHIPVQLVLQYGCMMYWQFTHIIRYTYLCTVICILHSRDKFTCKSVRMNLFGAVVWVCGFRSQGVFEGLVFGFAGSSHFDAAFETAIEALTGASETEDQA